MDKKYLISKILAIIVTAPMWAQPSAQEVFTEIYEVGLWGKDQEGKGTSGDGSIFENAMEYVVFLNKFIRKNNIKTIVDIGCGDWQVMSHVDLRGVNYIGIDVVQSVIDENQKKYSSSNVNFIAADCINDTLPEADLLLCKDVFNHIPNAGILKIMKQFNKYRHVLVTTDVEAATLTCCNRDIILGDWRSVDLSASPFYQTGKKILIYPAEYTYSHLKQVFYIEGKEKGKQ